MAGPSPCPSPRPGASVRNRRGPWSSRSPGKPGPWSRTSTIGASTVTTTGGGPCRCALTTRLARTPSSRRRSVRTIASRSIRTAASSPVPRTARSTSDPSSYASRSARSAPESSREISNRPSVRACGACSRSLIISLGRPSGSRSAEARMPVSGVRSSCATSAVKRRSAPSLPWSDPAIESWAAPTAATSSRPVAPLLSPGAPTRAFRSPAVIRRAMSAVVPRRRLTRWARKNPARATTPAARTADPRTTRSKDSSDRQVWAYGVHTARI